jgi:hypothetical protein
MTHAGPAPTLLAMAVAPLLLATPPALAQSVWLTERPPFAPGPIPDATSFTGLGLGVIVGEPTGLSGIRRMESGNAIDGAVAWSIPDARLHLHADFLHEFLTFSDPTWPGVLMPLYLGLGARFRLGFDASDADAPRSSVLGVRVPVGFSVIPDEYPLDAFIEVAPTVGLWPATRLDLDAGFGVRFFFNRKDPDRRIYVN